MIYSGVLLYRMAVISLPDRIIYKIQKIKMKMRYENQTQNNKSSHKVYSIIKYETAGNFCNSGLFLLDFKEEKQQTIYIFKTIFLNY